MQRLVIAAALIAAVYSQSTPIEDATVCGTLDNTGRRVSFVADAENSCVYWQCRSGGRRLIARDCPLGTAVSSFFGVSASNPCTERYDQNAVKFDCTRKEFNLSPEARPACFNEYTEQGTCKNGGVVQFELGVCTCDCTGTGFADWDCSKRQEELIGADNVHPNPDDPCPNGIPQTDWCAEAGEPCQNGGRCINQCINYVCQCVPPFTAGRNCETFDCTENVECLNGGTCSRGPDNLSPVASCQCPEGFSGMMCEIIGG